MQTYDFSRYLRARSAGLPGFSPDGTRLSFLWDVTGVPQVWTVPIAGGWPEQLTFHDERIGEARFSPRRDEIVFAMDRGGDERHALYLLRDAGANVIPLTDRPDAVHFFGGWSPDGSAIAYSANTRHPAYFDIYVRVLDEAEPRRVLEQDATHYALGWTPDEHIIAARYHTNMHNALVLVDPRGRTEPRLLTPWQGEALHHSPAATPDGRGLYFITNQDRDFAALAYLDLATLALDIVDAPAWDVETLVLAPDGRHLAYTVNVEGYSERRVRDMQAGRLLPLPALPRGAYENPRAVTSMLEATCAWSPDSRHLAVVAGGATRTPDIWMLDVAAGRSWPLTHSGRGGIPDDVLVEPAVIRYPTFDGRQIPALFFRSRAEHGDGGFPVVVEVHGGPEAQRRPSWNAPLQYLAGRGYAVFAPNVRGSTGYGKAYAHLDDVHLRMDSVRDLAHGVAWLTAHGADPRRIAVMGGSYGGFMVLAAVTTYPDLWAAAVDIVGIANFVTFLENTGPWRRALRESEYGSLAHDRAFLEEVSPIRRVEQITAPLLVIHGANDPRVPVGEAEQIVGTLRNLGRPVEYLRFEDEGHGLVKLHNRISGYSAIGAFLDRWLLSAR